MSEYLDPTAPVAVPRKTARRPSSLDGLVVTLLDISKAKGDHLLDRIEELLRERARPKAIVRKKKPTFARPAPEPLRAEIVGGAGVLSDALADCRACTSCDGAGRWVFQGHAIPTATGVTHAVLHPGPARATALARASSPSRSR